MRIKKDREIWIFVLVEVGKTLIEFWENRKKGKDHDGQGDSTEKRKG